MMTLEPSYQEQLQQALDFMKRADQFLVVSHVQPDGDAISAQLTIGWLLSKLGKSAIFMNESELPSRLQFLHQFEQIERYSNEENDVKYGNVITVDCADFKRIGAVSNLFAEQVNILNIDHHPTNNGFGQVNVIRADAAATVEVLYDLIALAGFSLDLNCATAIYTGLLTDTGGFRYSNTSAKVMQIVSHLLHLGVNGSQISDLLLEKMTMAKLQLLRLSLSRLTFDDKQQIGWVYILQTDMESTGAVSEDVEGIVNYALNVDGVQVGILFKEAEDGSIKASIRSAGLVDVAHIAQQFGGGGHKRAAGCRLEGDLNKAMNELLVEVRKAVVN
ncbi:bifunctional oligoribonuclease/PAP phosphatase NrnA [Paenibacillus yanchengensis]|uniref:Bifunctional oligoribonuclease/PAP phosphatase NrnA n=1 Tax=Paenibacillus yanchengensis TaxID=2035833 RepID=A0ABW4YM98_9BACL